MKFAPGLLLSLLAVAGAGPAFANDQLWAALRSEPNLVVLMRHATSSGGAPLAWDESGQCRGELRLNEEGRAMAKRIGEAFASRGIKPTVISSPMCRCLETARIAFGGQVATDPDLRETASANAARAQAFESKARQLIAKGRGAAPIAFVSHRPNIDQLTMELIDEGEVLVGRAAESGEISVLGKLVLGK